MTAEVFTSLPRSFRRDTHSAWSEARGSGPLHSFLEGPSFDRLGNLYCTDVCHGRIFRIDKRGHWELFADYGGQPNGLKIHQDGRIFVADAQYGILIFDPSTGERTSTWKGPEASLFQGVNDLYFGNDGTLFVTDPGASSLANPSGRVLVQRQGGGFEPIADKLPFPKVMSHDVV